jgi:hypothetical protein
LVDKIPGDSVFFFRISSERSSAQAHVVNGIGSKRLTVTFPSYAGQNAKKDWWLDLEKSNSNTTYQFLQGKI